MHAREEITPDDSDREVAQLLGAVVEIVRDDALDDDERALRLSQYRACALGARCPELFFDPVARRITAHVTALRGAARARWTERAEAFFGTLAPSHAPHEAAVAFLAETWVASPGHFPLRTGTSPTLDEGDASPPESFTAAVIADLLLDHPAADTLTERVVAMLERELAASDPVFHFFKDHGLLPADADCTSLAHSLLLRAGRPTRARAHAALDRIVAHVDERGVIATYFERTGARAGIVDPAVCANALYLAAQLGRADETRATARFVEAVLAGDTWLRGTRYYPSPETFLHFVGRLALAFPDVHGGLCTALRRALARRMGATAAPIDLAQRVHLARRLGVAHGPDEALLRSLRRGDGAWPTDALFRYGRSGVLFGSSSLSTAFAASALAPARPA